MTTALSIYLVMAVGRSATTLHTFELVNLDLLGSLAASGVELFTRQCLNSIIDLKLILLEWVL